MENEAYGLTDSFVSRHTTDPTLRLELLSRNQNGLRHDQGIGMGEEVRKIEYSIALKVRRGELILLVWDYVVGRLGQGRRFKDNSPKLRLRSPLLLTMTLRLEKKNYETGWFRKFGRTSFVKNWFRIWQKYIIKNYKMISRKYLLFSLSGLPLLVYT